MSTSDLILVTGATGKIGSSIAKHLKRLGKNIRLLARDPNKLFDFPDSDKVRGDYGDVASLDRAFTGASSAFNDIAGEGSHFKETRQTSGQDGQRFASIRTGRRSDFGCG